MTCEELESIADIRDITLLHVTLTCETSDRFMKTMKTRRREKAAIKVIKVCNLQFSAFLLPFSILLSSLQLSFP